MAIKKPSTQKGISLVISLIMTTLLLAISLSIGSIILRQLKIISISTNSQSAFYAADSALECALYWDTKTDGTIDVGDFESSIFGPITTYTENDNPIKCGTYSGNPINFQKVVAEDLSVATTTFEIGYEKTCARIQVVKYPARTLVATRGYNVQADSSGCQLDNAIDRRIVERGLIFRH